MNIARILGKPNKGIRIDRITVDGIQLSGGIVVASSKGRSVEVTTVLTRPRSLKAIVALLKAKSPRIVGGANVEWLQAMQPKVEAIAVRMYDAATKAV